MHSRCAPAALRLRSQPLIWSFCGTGGILPPDNSLLSASSDRRVLSLYSSKRGRTEFGFAALVPSVRVASVPCEDLLPGSCFSATAKFLQISACFSCLSCNEPLLLKERSPPVSNQRSSWQTSPETKRLKDTGGYR